MMRERLPEGVECDLCRGYGLTNQGHNCARCGGSGVLSAAHEAEVSRLRAENEKMR